MNGVASIMQDVQEALSGNHYDWIHYCKPDPTGLMY
jgi:hypothetical protein